eukprot:4874029-Prymnesium_polylepis.1
MSSSPRAGCSNGSRSPHHREASRPWLGPSASPARLGSAVLSYQLSRLAVTAQPGTRGSQRGVPPSVGAY